VIVSYPVNVSIAAFHTTYEIFSGILKDVNLKLGIINLLVPETLKY
jgi:hypothetical protein